MDYILTLALRAGVIIAAFTLLASFLVVPSILNINIIMICISFISGVVTPIVNATLMDRFRDHVTILSAVMSGVRVCGAGFLVLVTTNISLDTLWPLAIYISILTLLSLFIFKSMQRDRTVL